MELNVAGIFSLCERSLVYNLYCYPYKKDVYKEDWIDSIDQQHCVGNLSFRPQQKILDN